MASVLLLIAASGLVAAVAQVVLIRELLVVFDGNELMLGLFFATWLFWVAVGSLLGGLVSRRAGLRPLQVMLAASGVLAVCQVLMVRTLRQWLGFEFGQILPAGQAVLAASAALAPLCLLVGAQFAVACRVAAPLSADAARRVYVAEGAGFALGGVLAAFVAAPHLSSVQAAVALALVASIASWAGASVGGGRIVPHWSALLAALIAAFAALGGPARLETGSLRRLWRPLSVVDCVNSPHGNIVAASRAGQISFYVSGKYVASAGDALAAEQTAHLCLLQHPRPRTALLIGGTASGIIPHMLSHHLRRLVYVELDARLIALVRRHSRDEFTGFSDPRVEAVFADARQWCRQSSQQFDLILVSVPEPATVLLTRFYTLEFFQQARRLLTPAGVLVVSLPAHADYFSEEDLALQGTVYRTLKAVFPNVLVTPTSQRFFFASAGNGISLDPNELFHRFQERRVAAQHFHPYLLYDLLPPDRVGRVQDALRQIRAPLTTDFAPVACFRAQRLWNLAAASIPPSAMRWLDDHPWQAMVGLLSLFAVPGLAGSARRGRRLALLGGLAAFGMAGMVVEVALLLAFQVIWGHVYAHLGLIVAAFMLGMVAGGVIPGVKRGLVEKAWASWAAVLGIAAAYLLILPHAIRVPPTPVGALWFYALVSSAGLITGLAYPVGVALLPGETGGLAYGADLLGACLGALVAGAFLLPVSGVAQSLHALAGLFAALAAFWLIRPS